MRGCSAQRSHEAKAKSGACSPHIGEPHPQTKEPSLMMRENLAPDRLYYFGLANKDCHPIPEYEMQLKDC